MPQKDEHKLVFLTSVFGMVNAHILKGRLESCDIPCMLAPHKSNVFPSLLNSEVIYVNLMVREIDLAKAQSILMEDDSEYLPNSNHYDEGLPG